MSSPVLSQHMRLITIKTSQGSLLPESLVVESFEGSESINGSFEFDIQALSTSAHLDLHPFIGEEITLRLQLADHQYRVWHGYCQEASWIGADGGFARYHLRLTPFLNFLKHRYDAYIFQNKNAYEIIEELLADYPQANFRWESQKRLRSYPIYTQYRENDFDFLIRLLSNEGLNFRFDHFQDEIPSHQPSPSHAKHCLVIFDEKNEIPILTGQPEIRFHAVRATEAEDSIHQFSAMRQVHSNAVNFSSWHEDQLVANSAEAMSIDGNGEQPILPVYQGSVQQQFEDADSALVRNEALLQAKLFQQHRLRGASGARQLAPGYAFKLTKHDRYLEPNNHFCVQSVSHLATNNFIHGVHQEAEQITAAAIDLFTNEHIPIYQLERGIYRNRFEVTPIDIPNRPISVVNKASTPQLGPQPAIVVGYENASLTTDRKQRIKVQFMWQRGVKPVNGGLQDPNNWKDKIGNAPFNEASGTWVRVAEALAGPNWGSQFTPRIGTEVLVQFAEGDADLPLIVATLFNGHDTPPFRAGIDSGVNHAGVVSGWHLQGLDRQGFNQWIIDDTEGQLRMRLATSLANSQLNLGYLVQQSPWSAQRGVWRGEGFELRTQAWGVLRGQEGILISTTPRPHFGASVVDTQMNMLEAVQAVKTAEQVSARMQQHALHQQVKFSQMASTSFSQCISHTDVHEQGHYDTTINTQAAYKPQQGNRTLNTSQSVERLHAPWLVIDSANSVHWASAATSLMACGEQLLWTTHADALLTSGYHFSGVSGLASSLFSHAGGIHATSANGPMSLRAHTNNLQLWADKAVSITATQDNIVVKAKQLLKLNAGQSALTIEGSQITFACPGKFTVKTGKHAFKAAGRLKTKLNKLPGGKIEIPTSETPLTPTFTRSKEKNS